MNLRSRAAALLLVLPLVACHHEKVALAPQPAPAPAPAVKPAPAEVKPAPAPEAKPAPAPAPAAVAEPAPIAGRGYQLVFNEEFEGPKGGKPDPRHWGHWYLGKRHAAVNVADAALLDGAGNLLVTSRMNGDVIESGGIMSRGKFEATCGYFECRARMNSKPGVRTAIWLQSRFFGKAADSPAGSGMELDINEYLGGRRPDVIHHTVHWGGYGENHRQNGDMVKVPGTSQGFHTYALKWDDEGYVFYVDGQETLRMPPGEGERGKKPLTAPLTKMPCYIMLSSEVEINGWAGTVDPAQLPDDFAVDWFRIWQTPAQAEADLAAKVPGR